MAPGIASLTLHRQQVACRRRLWRSCAAQVYKRVPLGWARVGHKRLIFLDELAEIQPLVTAGGIGVLCSSSKGDLPTSPALEDLLNAGQGFGGTFKGPGVGQENAAYPFDLQSRSLLLMRGL